MLWVVLAVDLSENKNETKDNNMKTRLSRILYMLGSALIISSGCAKQESNFNISQFRAAHEAIWNTGDFSRLGEFYAPDYKVRTADKTASFTVEEMKKHVLDARKAFPDLQVTIDDLIQQGDTVAIRKTYRGTHKEPFQLSADTIIQPTGKKVEFSEMAFYKLKNGKLFECVVIGDTLSLMKQLGVMK